MRSACCGLLLLSLFVAGCTKSSAKSTEGLGNTPSLPAKTAEDTAKAHYENFRSGLYQIDNAVGTLEESLAATKALESKTSGEAKGALADVADLLDSAGATLSDANVDEPTFEEYNQQFAAYDERRIKGIDSAVDAYHETKHARGILDDLAANAPKVFSADLKKIISSTDDAIDQMTEAIVSLGGKVPTETEVSDSSGDVPVTDGPAPASAPKKGR